MRFIPSVMFSVETESRDFFTIFKRAVNLLAAMAFRPVPRIYYGQTGETCLFRTGSWNSSRGRMERPLSARSLT